MALERLEALPSCSIPHHHLSITAGADDPVALESNGIHWTLMPLESGEEGKGVSIPDTDKSIFRAADDVLVIDAKIENTPRVSVEDGRNMGPGSIGE